MSAIAARVVSAIDCGVDGSALHVLRRAQLVRLRGLSRHQRQSPTPTSPQQPPHDGPPRRKANHSRASRGLGGNLSSVTGATIAPVSMPRWFVTIGRARCGERAERSPLRAARARAGPPGTIGAQRALAAVERPSPRCRAADPRTRSPAAPPRRPCRRCARRTRAAARRRSASAPETSRGCACIAARTRASAASSGVPDGPRVARFLKPRASADSGRAKFGALQPSVPVRRLASVELARVGDGALDRALDRRIGIEVALGRDAERARDARGSRRACRSSCGAADRDPRPRTGGGPPTRMPIGQCAPQRSCSTSAPAFASRRAATARWMSLPSCDAVASASSSSSIASAVAGARQAQRQRLQRLDRRAREGDQLRIAERVDDAAVTVDDGRRRRGARLRCRRRA